MYVSILGIFLASFAPGVSWLAYWYYRAHFGPRRLRPVIAFFLSGLLAGPLAMAFFSFLALSPFYSDLDAIDSVSELEKFIYAIFAIGPVEEMAKFLVAWLALQLFPREMNPAIGGVVYAAASALGFATIENWYYMIDVDEVVWHRALTLPFNHVLFSSFWGVGLSLYYTRPRRRVFWLTTGLALSFIYHGLYDYFLISDAIPAVAVLPLVLILWVWLVIAIPKLRAGIANTDEEDS
ncbi:MAG: PrsW family intramembrane metalloprotease [Deltaproteobacteria bacterium]|nr:PrsW family intramembrane metalloprotease [Deltaproteobacteria bacterium]MCB9788176.1 PrsW family intramembrane metalloprotease [Deltaproteobacteria bacterium]